MRELQNTPPYYPVEEYHYEWMLRAWLTMQMRLHGIERLDVRGFPASKFGKIFPDQGGWGPSLVRPTEKTLPFLRRIGLQAELPEVVAMIFCIQTTQYILDVDPCVIRKNAAALRRLRAELHKEHGVQPHPESLLRKATLRGILT